MTEVAEVSRRVRQMIERARADATERRARADADTEIAQRFIQDVATPVARQVASVLRSEGFAFRLSTPPGAVRLVSEARTENDLDVAVDTTVDPVTITTEVSHERGRRVSTVERPLRADAALSALTDQDVLLFFLEALPTFVARQ